MISKFHKVLMLGWEFPPHNSGGLGVACQGLTQALSESQEIMFTLPFNFDHEINFMEVYSCLNNKINNPNSNFSFHQQLLSKNLLPFAPYLKFKKKDSIKWNPNWEQYLDNDNFDFCPETWIEKQVYEYTNNVFNLAVKKKDEFALVHAHDWMTFPAAIKIKQKLKKPFIAHIHSTEIDRSGINNVNSTIVKIEKKAMEFADQIITVSYYTKRLLIEKYEIDANKIIVVHNGIMPAITKIKKIKNHFAKRQKVIVFMGRLTKQKGPEYFIDLAYKILEKEPNYLFVVAGDGDLYQELLFKSAGKKLAASVLFSGFIRGKQQEKLLDRADVFVMPSVSEPFGLVALEAAKAKIPVVISNQTGVSEVLIGNPQVDFWDTDKMASEVLKILNDTNYQKKLIKQQFKSLRNISWKKAALKIKNIYRSFIY